MLKIRNLQVGYKKLKVLKNISLHINTGEIVTIIGANGAGKTTLLSTIAGIIPSAHGEIIFDNNHIHHFAAETIVQLGCSIVPEGRQIFSTMTIKENLILGSYPVKKRRKKSIHSELKNIFQLFPILQERQEQLAGTLSGGEQQMLAIARALMAQPKLLVLDEPSMGLAPLLVKTIFNVIKQLRQQGKTILLVEQNAKASLTIADRGYVLETGQIILEGTSSELLNNNDVQRAYLGKEYKDIGETI